MMKNLITLLIMASTCLLSAQMPNTISNEDKVYGLSKFWQEVNYNYIYLNKVDKVAWNKMYRELITEVQETKNDYEYFRLLQKFCATLKDGHTNIYMPRKIRDSLYNTYFGDYRLFLTNIEGKAIITRVNASKKEELPIGTEIIKVNGIKTKKYLKKYVIPYISSSTDHILEDWGINQLLKAPVGTSFDLEFKLPNGKIKSLKLTHEIVTEKEVYPPFGDQRQLLDFKWLENDIAYISLNSFSNEKINELFEEKLPELYKAKKLIVDLRYNGGGSTGIGRDILKYLTNDTILYGSKYQSRLHIPSFKAWGVYKKAKDTVNNEWAKKSYLAFKDERYYDFEYEADTIDLKSKRIVVPTAVLIGHNTASAAEDFLIYADNQSHITKIGEPTFGSTGQPFQFAIPGGGSARICTKKDTYPDGREFVGVGIQPDVEVKKTLQDYLNGSDPVLQKALEYLDKK